MSFISSFNSQRTSIIDATAVPIVISAVYSTLISTRNG